MEKWLPDVLAVVLFALISFAYFSRQTSRARFFTVTTRPQARD